MPNGPIATSLVEIGPRFVLTPIRIFEGAFGGATVFSNPGMLASHLQSPLFLPCFCSSQRLTITSCRIRYPQCGTLRRETRRGYEVSGTEGGRGREERSERREEARGGRVGCHQSICIVYVYHDHIVYVTPASFALSVDWCITLSVISDPRIGV